jgi:hypothetical protein
MGNIENYSGKEFPGAKHVLLIGLDGSDCTIQDSFEKLVRALQTASQIGTTIRDRRAYTEATDNDLTTVCDLE